MRWSETAVVVLVVVALLVWLVWVSASRLDRLHRKVGASRSVVETQLVRRATAAAELATSGLLDPVSSVLVGEAAWAALSTEGGATAPDAPADLRALLSSDPRPAADRAFPAADGASPEDVGRVESELSATLREVLADEDEVRALRDDPAGGELLEALSSSWYRVELSRRFHNEAVLQTQRVRRGPFVRMLRLAGHAPEPRTLELDDAWPTTLGRPGVRA